MNSGLDTQNWVSFVLFSVWNCCKLNKHLKLTIIIKIEHTMVGTWYFLNNKITFCSY